MTYLHAGAELLDAQEHRLYTAVRRLNRAGRTTNTSQVAAAAGLGRTTATNALHHLKARGYIRDISRGAAYHWRLTGKAAWTAAQIAALGWGPLDPDPAVLCDECGARPAAYIGGPPASVRSCAACIVSGACSGCGGPLATAGGCAEGCDQR